MPGLKMIDVVLTANPTNNTLTVELGVGGEAVNVPSAAKKYDAPGVKPVNPSTRPAE